VRLRRSHAASEAEERLQKRLRRRIERRRRKLLLAGVPDAASLHPFRIAAKELRYGLEVVRPFLPAAGPLLPHFRRLQDAAGEAHDKAELASAVKAMLTDLPAAERRRAAPLAAVLSRDAGSALRKARASAKILLDELDDARFVWRMGSRLP
jgi:CHAD domain-containing protein